MIYITDDIRIDDGMSQEFINTRKVNGKLMVINMSKLHFLRINVYSLSPANIVIVQNIY